jgi:hypothetical protein
MAEIGANYLSALAGWGVKVQRRCPFDRISMLFFINLLKSL